MSDNSIRQLVSQQSLVAKQLTKYLTDLKSRCSGLPNKVLQRLYNNSGNQTYEKICQPIKLVHAGSSASNNKEKKYSLDINEEPPKEGKVTTWKPQTKLNQLETWTLQNSLSSDRAVIVGPAGAGKTWLLHGEALDLAEKALKLLEKNDLDHVKLPILAELKDLQSDKDLETSLVDNLRHEAGNSAGSYAKKAMGQGRCVLLLDTWEGVDRKDKVRLQQHIDRFVKSCQFTGCGILITSRPNMLNLQEIDQTLSVSSLSLDRIEKYVYTWFSSNKAYANRLITTLQNRPALRELAQVPFMLLMLCASNLWKNESEDSPTALQIFDDCVGRLIEYWRSSSGAEGKYGPNQMVNLVSRLREAAVWLFVEGAYQSDPYTMEQAMGYGEEDPDKAADIAISVAKEIGLLSAVDNKNESLKFLHSRIQEYFVACLLGDSINKNNWSKKLRIRDGSISVEKCLEKYLDDPDKTEFMILLTETLNSTEELLKWSRQCQSPPKDQERYRLWLQVYFWTLLPESDFRIELESQLIREIVDYIKQFKGKLPTEMDIDSLKHACHTVGNTVYHIGRFDEAERWYTAALAIDPKLVESYFNRGLTRTRQSEYAAAGYDLDTCIDICGKYDYRLAEVRYLRGLIYEYSENYKNAIKQYKEALSIDPGYNSPTKQMLVCECKIVAGKIDKLLQDRKDKEANDLLEKTLRKHRENKDCSSRLEHLARILSDKEHHPQAVKAARAALDVDPTLKDAKFTLAFSLSEVGQHEEARDAYRNYLEKHKDDGRSWNNLSFEYLILEYPYRAAVAACRALVIEAGETGFAACLATDEAVFEKLDLPSDRSANIDDIFSNGKKAFFSLNIERCSCEALGNAGEALYKLDKVRIAAHLLEAAKKKGSNYSSTSYYLGMCYLDMDRKEEALEQWRCAVECEPSSEDGLMAAKKLKEVSDGPST